MKAKVRFCEHKLNSSFVSSIEFYTLFYFIFWLRLLL